MFIFQIRLIFPDSYNFTNNATKMLSVCTGIVVSSNRSAPGRPLKDAPS